MSWVFMRVDVSVPIGIITVALVILGLVQLSELHRRVVEARLREAWRVTDLSLTKAALYMELHSASDLEKMLSGERKLDLWRLEMLPDETRRVYHALAVRDLGLPELFKAAIKMAPAFEQKKESA